MKNNCVYITGAGPGDPDLLTIKALNIIKQADVILYDRLINTGILNYSKKDCIKIYCGKQNTGSGKLQDSINNKLFEYAKQYETVVRLKGGDPFIFGRGAEEAEFLFKNNIQFKIIPGISSGIAGSAYAGIPVTHRNYSSSVLLITGHGRDNSDNIDYKKLASSKSTLVFYMGVKNILKISEELIKHGMHRNTPVAIIQNATTPMQKNLFTSLGKIHDSPGINEITPPSIIVIGKTVDLHKQLNWYIKQPLFSKKILVTRSEMQSDTFCKKLLDQGASPVKFPLINIINKSDFLTKELLLQKLLNIKCILFNSANGAEIFFNHIAKLGLDSRILGNVKIGAVGEATLKILNSFFIQPDFMPDEYRVTKLIEKTAENVDKNSNVLVVTSNLSPIVPDKVKHKHNINIEKMELYRTEHADINIEELVTILDNGLDCITFMSSSTVESFIKTFNKLEKRHQVLIKNCSICAIGPETADTLKKYGFEANITADIYTMDGMIDKMIEYYS